MSNLFLGIFFKFSLFIAFLKFSESIPTGFYALNYFDQNSKNPKIKFVVFTKGRERGQEEAVQKLLILARLYGNLKVEEHEMPSGISYLAPKNQLLEASWYKIQVINKLLALNTLGAEWIVALDLSALPENHDSQELNFAALIDRNPKISTFLKKIDEETCFGMMLLKFNENSKRTFQQLWRQSSEETSASEKLVKMILDNPYMMAHSKYI